MPKNIGLHITVWPNINDVYFDFFRERKSIVELHNGARNSISWLCQYVLKLN